MTHAEILEAARRSIAHPDELVSPRGFREIVAGLLIIYDDQKRIIRDLNAMVPK